MAIFAISSFLLGAVLGHRFKVLILVPTIFVGTAVAIGFGIARGDDVWLIGLTVTLASVCLQFGYLCGAVIVSLVVDSRATRIRDRKFAFKQAVSR
jgi:hypothetical protein